MFVLVMLDVSSWCILCYLQRTLCRVSYLFLFFKQKTVYEGRISDWSSDVCSSDLLLIGYPIAYAMMRALKRWRFALRMMVILPFWTSFLIRVYAWIGILKKEGLLNLALLNLGVIDQPLTILNTDTAVYIGIDRKSDVSGKSV